MDLTAQHRDLVAKDQDLDLLRPIAPYAHHDQLQYLTQDRVSERRHDHAGQPAVHRATGDAQNRGSTTETMFSSGTGASAGATLTAGATLRLRDNGQPIPGAVVLVYPIVHAALPPMSTELAAKVDTLPDPDAVGAEAVSRMNLDYVREPAALQDLYAFPGGHDLTGLPPTFILNSDIDSLRASGQEYGAELAAAGVDVVMIREDGVRHGHLNEPDNPGAARSINRMADWLLSPTLVGAAHERQE